MLRSIFQYLLVFYASIIKKRKEKNQLIDMENKH